MKLIDLFATDNKKARLEFVNSCLVAFAKYNVDSGGKLPVIAMHEFAKGIVATLEAHVHAERKEKSKVHTLFPFKRSNYDANTNHTTTESTTCSNRSADIYFLGFPVVGDKGPKK